MKRRCANKTKDTVVSGKQKIMVFFRFSAGVLSDGVSNCQCTSHERVL